MADVTMVRVKKAVMKQVKVEAARADLKIQEWVERALLAALKNKKK